MLRGVGLCCTSDGQRLPDVRVTAAEPGASM
jgi:hypothetical protein